MTCSSTTSSDSIQVYKNRDRTVRVTITTDVGDITGSKLWLTVKDDINSLDSAANILKKSANNGGSDLQCMITDGPNRIIEFYFVPLDTASLEAEEYNVDAVIQLPSGKKVQLITPRAFIVLNPVTKA